MLRATTQSRTLIGPGADRPEAHRVPEGTIFYANEGGFYVRVGEQWVQPTAATPITALATDRLDPEFSPMNVQRRFKYTCPRDYGGSYNEPHDTYDFFWDGIRNVADRKSIELASMFDELQSGSKKCRCGQYLQGKEIQSVPVPEARDWFGNATAAPNPMLTEIQSLQANLHTLFGMVGELQKSMHVIDKKMTAAAPAAPIALTLKEKILAAAEARAMAEGKISQAEGEFREAQRKTSMAANFYGVDSENFQRLFAMAEGDMTVPTFTPEEIAALRQRIGLRPQSAAERQYLMDTAPNRPTETLEATTPTERTPMTAEDSKIKKIGKTLKANAGEAAWRVGAAQATRTAKAAVVTGVLRNIPKTEKALRKQITAFFDTSYGDAVVGLLLSGAISMTGAPEGSKRDRLAEELRVGAMSVAANEALNGLLDPLRGFMVGGLDAILDGLPDVEKVRVDASSEAAGEEETVAATGARARATG